MKGKGGLALSQVTLMVVSIIAIAYILGSSIHVVGAQGTEQCVQVYNSGKTQVIPLPSGFTSIEQYCATKPGTNCRASQCISSATTESTGIPPAAIIPSAQAVIPQLRGGDLQEQAQGQELVKPVEPPKPEDVGGEAAKLSIGTILKNAGAALAIYVGARLILPLLGASPEFTNAASLAAAGGYFVGKSLVDIGLVGGVAGLGIGVAVAGLIFAATFKQTRHELVSFSCLPWDAPLGGESCGECNQGDFPCTEYRCRSLGQACGLDNKGTTEELCIWKNRNDTSFPFIQPWEDTLTTGHRYSPDNAVSPPDRGVNIVPETAGTGGCVAPFTPLRFGVTLDEPAKCKIDFTNKRNFDEMQFFFGGSSTSKYNHSQTMSLPSPAALAAENITLQNGGEFSLYARCQDANGNANTGNFVFNFCVDDGPDTTPPLVVTTSILNGAPIAFNQTQTDLQVYVNEPTECRWSHLDKAYDDMETQMTCRTGALEFNAQMLYQCSTTLDGLKSAVNNDFYFRCKDQPHLEGTEQESQRNTNQQSYKFTLKGTIPLVIDTVGPNGTISDSTDVIKVTLTARTSAGHDRGASVCEYSPAGENRFNEFFKTGTHEHSQDLFLTEGTYSYDIRCTDLGGNTDEETVSFAVETDTTAPTVVRIFRQGQDLKIITNEPASCVYITSVADACTYLFEEGTSMSTTDDRIHSVAWQPDRSFYIKCSDEFGNQPLPNQCNIIARPFEV